MKGKLYGDLKPEMDGVIEKIYLEEEPYGYVRVRVRLDEGTTMVYGMPFPAITRVGRKFGAFLKDFGFKVGEEYDTDRLAGVRVRVTLDMDSLEPYPPIRKIRRLRHGEKV
jgi:hypothetical protein